MKFLQFFSVAFFVATLASAIPHAMPVPNTQFEIDNFMGGLIESKLSQADFAHLNTLTKRASNSSGISSLLSEDAISGIIKAVNNSGIIFSLLNDFAGHPDRIEKLANITGNLIKGYTSSNSSGSSAFSLEKLTNSVNITELIGIVEGSGLVQSIADGILLDESYRPVLVNLTYRILNSNKNVILYAIDTIFAKSNNQKRADSYSGSLGDFAANLAYSFLGSSLFTNSLENILGALNDTGVAVYVVKRALANESYQNMTAEFAKDLYATGAINIDPSAFNVTGLIDSVLSDPSVITNTINSVISGSGNSSSSLNGLFSSLGKYAGAFKSITSDLEATGIFQELNDYIFPSSTSSSAKPTSSAKAKLDINNKAAQNSTTSGGSSASTTKTASSSSHGAAGSLRADSTFMKVAVFLQSVVFGGLLLV